MGLLQNFICTTILAVCWAVQSYGADSTSTQTICSVYYLDCNVMQKLANTLGVGFSDGAKNLRVIPCQNTASSSTDYFTFPVNSLFLFEDSQENNRLKLAVTCNRKNEARDICAFIQKSRESEFNTWKYNYEKYRQEPYEKSARELVVAYAGCAVGLLGLLSSRLSIPMPRAVRRAVFPVGVISLIMGLRNLITYGFIMRTRFSEPDLPPLRHRWNDEDIDLGRDYVVFYSNLSMKGHVKTQVNSDEEKNMFKIPIVSLQRNKE